MSFPDGGSRRRIKYEKSVKYFTTTRGTRGVNVGAVTRSFTQYRKSH